jgi:Post-segregation antitoxin CcdA
MGHLDGHSNEQELPVFVSGNGPEPTLGLNLQTAEQWLSANQEAIAAYSRFVEKRGIWNEGSRAW